MWTDQDYQKAVSMLPTLDPERKRALGSKIVKYESLNPQVKSPDLGGLPERPAVLDQPKAPESTGDIVSSVQSAEAKPKIPGGSSEEERASLRLDTTRATELPKAAPSTLFQDDATLGGTLGLVNTRFYEEPSLEQFQADMGQVDTSGGQYAGADQNSRAYRAYADKLWAEEYAKAKAEGRNVVRISQAPQALKMVGSAGNAVGAAGMAALDIVTLGATAGPKEPEVFDNPIEEQNFRRGEGARQALGIDRKNQQRIRSAHPIADVGGQIAGYLSPGAPISLATNAANRAASKVLPTTSTVLRTARSGGVGGAVAGGESLARDVVQGEELDPERAAIAAALGGPSAALGELVGTASGRSAERTFDKPGVGEVIEPFEKSGGAFGPVLGARHSPRARQTIRGARAADVDPIAQGVSDVRKPLASGALAVQESELAELGPRMTRYYEATRGARRPMTELGDALITELKRRTQVGGQDEAFVQRTGELRQHIQNVFEVHPTRDIAQARQTAKSRPGAKIYSRQQLEDMGLGDLAPRPQAAVSGPGTPAPPSSTQEAATRVTGQGPALANRALPPYPVAKPPILESGLTGPGGGEYFVLSARAKNPQEADVIIDAIDQRGKADGVGKAPDPMYERFMGQARAVRERFPANDVAPNTDTFELDDGRRVTGFSALKARHDAARTGVRSRNERGGLPVQVPGAAARRPGEPRVPDLSEQQWVRFESNLRNIAQSGGTPESHAAVKDFATQKGILDELRNIRQVGLREKAGEVSGGAIYASSGGHVGSGNVLRAFDRRSLPLRAALAGDGNSLKEVADAMSPGLRESLRRVRAGADPSILPGYYQAPPSNLSFLGLRGGRTGPLANAGPKEEDADPELTEEDVENLITLLEATK